MRKFSTESVINTADSTDVYLLIMQINNNKNYKKPKLTQKICFSTLYRAF